MKSLIRLYRLNKGSRKLNRVWIYIQEELDKEDITESKTPLTERAKDLLVAGAELSYLRGRFWTELDETINGIVARIQGGAR